MRRPAFIIAVVRPEKTFLSELKGGRLVREMVDATLESYKRIWLEKRDARYLPAAVEATIDEGDKEEALQLCMEGIQLGEMSSTLGVLAGGLLISLGRKEEAARILGEVVQADPGNSEASRLLRVVKRDAPISGEFDRRVGTQTARRYDREIAKPDSDARRDGKDAVSASEAKLDRRADTPSFDMEFERHLPMPGSDSPVVKRIRDIVDSID